MGTLNLGTMNFGDDVFINSRPDIVKISLDSEAALLLGNATASELPVAGAGTVPSAPLAGPAGGSRRQAVRDPLVH